MDIGQNGSYTIEMVGDIPMRGYSSLCFFAVILHSKSNARVVARIAERLAAQTHKVSAHMYIIYIHTRHKTTSLYFNTPKHETMEKKLSIIAFSGDFDKLTAVFTLATGAAAVGYEVNIFFTFWGLDAIKKKKGRAPLGGNWLTKTFGVMMGGLSVAPNSRFNFFGIGPKIFRSLMRKNNVATLEELVDAAKLLGVNLYACEMAMHVLGLKREDFIPEVKDVLGVASFLKFSEGGQTLFI